MTDLRGQLQVIHDQHGELTPQLVVDTAKPKDHPLHGHVYDRPRKEAADAWYLHRAEVLIRSVTVRKSLPNGDKVDLRAFSPVRPEQPGVYDPLEDIVQNDVSSAVLLQMMEREWTSMKRRYDAFGEFWQMVRRDIA